MREMFVETRTQCDETGKTHSFDYYILIDQMEVREGMACESYGIKVCQTGGGDEARVPNVTTSIARIDTLLGMLGRNLVSPSSLRDVVLDWL